MDNNVTFGTRIQYVDGAYGKILKALPQENRKEYVSRLLNLTQLLKMDKYKNDILVIHADENNQPVIKWIAEGAFPRIIPYENKPNNDLAWSLVDSMLKK